MNHKIWIFLKKSSGTYLDEAELMSLMFPLKAFQLFDCDFQKRKIVRQCFLVAFLFANYHTVINELDP